MQVNCGHDSRDWNNAISWHVTFLYTHRPAMYLGVFVLFFLAHVPDNWIEIFKKLLFFLFLVSWFDVQWYELQASNSPFQGLCFREVYMTWNDKKMRHFQMAPKISLSFYCNMIAEKFSGQPSKEEEVIQMFGVSVSRKLSSTHSNI